MFELLLFYGLRYKINADDDDDDDDDRPKYFGASGLDVVVR